MVRVLSTRVRTRALLSDSAMLKGMSSVASMSRSMIGWEHRTSREEMSMSSMKGTSPPSAATPAPRERRHEAATKSDTAPGSASPVDKYPTRASATLRRRSDDSIDDFSNLALHVRAQPPTCPLPNLAALTWERRRTHTKCVPKWDRSQRVHRSETDPEAGSCGLSHGLPNRTKLGASMERLINIDNGGTLTDICVWDGTEFMFTKTLTTPFDLSQCLFDGITKASTEIYGQPALPELPHSTKHIRYSTTQGTNALVERKGPRIGLITDDIAVVDELRGSAA